MSIINKLKQQQEEAFTGIDMSPLLDVVFILLIFFIVSTVFVSETGIEVDKPQSISADQLEKTAILIAITQQGNVIYDGAQIGVSGVRRTVEQLLSRDERPVVIQTDKRVPAELLVEVIDQAKLGGSASISIATVQK
jgi:biopolymer transport protein ExbD